MQLNDYEIRHNEQLRTLAPECTVLLKKDGSFPLEAPCPIALYGSGARLTIKGGTGSGDVNSRFFVTAEQGLKDAGFTVTTASWLDNYDAIRVEAKKAFIEDVKRIAKEKHTMAIMEGMGKVMPEPAYELPVDGEGTVCAYVLARNSGEGNDRKSEEGDIKLTATEIRDILACASKYDKFILILNVGGPVDLTPVKDVPNVLILSQLGVVTGQVLADLLLGTSVPSGKLTTTWTKADEYCTIGDFGDPDDTYYKEGVYVGYRYFDTMKQEVMYPFGFGLSYSEFELGKAETAITGTEVTVTVPVKNAGNFAGKEVIQLYVSAPWGKLDQPYQSLAAFTKTETLAPGEEAVVTLRFGMETIASYDAETASSILESGDYILRVGNSSRNTTPCAAVEVAETITVRKLTNVGGSVDFQDWKPAQPDASETAADLPKLILTQDVVDALTWKAPYEPSNKARLMAASLSDKDLLRLCHGNFKEGAFGLLSVVGNASSHVAGAAGESTDKIDGVPCLVMADGPAGLRLSKEYVKDKKGVHSYGSELPAGMEEYLGKLPLMFINMANKPRKNEEIRNQYCTAIPIGTALAQSWNMPLCMTMGDIVGEEMELFGVDLWLAPAFNIHRSIRCGRNFEYCSEDPLLSGKVGAAITLGVQKHPGKGTTIKHFCCNNQETQRYTSNSHVSERALREIYVRAFEICIRESQPLALMTSYNLLNGTHTSERSDLLQTLLREEWGYEGLIMTDWVVPGMALGKAKYRAAKSAPVLAAGNDLFMPATPGDYSLALSALKGNHKEFKLTRAEAELCAAHIMDVAWKVKG